MIPLWLAVSAIGGGAIWLTTLHLQTAANAATLQDMAAKQDRYLLAMEEIRESLSEIKGELKILNARQRSEWRVAPPPREH